MEGGNASITTTTQDADFTIIGNDGGSDINALTFDMSEAGAASFNGFVGIGTTTLNKVFNIADPAQGGETLKLHFEANSSADNWEIYGYDRTNSHYTNMSFGNSAVYIQADKKVGIGTASPQAHLDINTETAEATTVILNGEANQDKILKFRHYENSEAAGDGYAGFIGSVVSGGILTLGHYTSANSEVQALHINESGNVGIGTTSPTNVLDLGAATLSRGLTFANYSNLFSEYSNASLWLSSNFYGTAGGSGYKTSVTANYGAAGIRVHGTGGASTSGQIEFYVDDNSSKTADAAFTPTERMRILSTGTVCIGTTHEAVDNTNGVFIRETGDAYSNIGVNGSTWHVRHDYNWRFYVTNMGVVNAQTTSITAISDQRLKENIKDLETGLTEVLALKPRRFDWKESEKVDRKNIAGFIAQEVETVLPDLIGDYKHDRISDAKSLRMGDMIPTLVKAIQELSTKLDAAEARIKTLEDA